jgi:TonB family protein
MKLPGWIAISIGIHMTVIAAVVFLPKIRLAVHDKDASFIQLAEDVPSPVRNPLPPRFLPSRPRFDPAGDATNKEVLTNFLTNENLPESDHPDSNVGAFDSAGYSPFYSVDEAPAALSAIEPVYPEEARKLGIEGQVVLKLYIDETGALRGLEVAETPGDAFSKAAREAIANVRFRPAYVGGHPCAAWVRLSLRFRLE